MPELDAPPASDDETVDDVAVDDVAVDDEALAALALAADPDLPLAPDAEPWRAEPGDGEADAALLPGWYMPPAAAPVRSPIRRAAGLAVVASLVLINASGLCITYGYLVAA